MLGRGWLRQGKGRKWENGKIRKERTQLPRKGARENFATVVPGAFVPRCMFKLM